MVLLVTYVVQKVIYPVTGLAALTPGDGITAHAMWHLIPSGEGSFHGTDESCRFEGYPDCRA